MILAAEIYGVSGKLFIPAANGCLFIVTAKTKRTKKKQLWQNFLLPTSSVVDTYAILIAVVDQTVLESVMDTFALVISVTQLNLFYIVFSKSMIIKPIRRTILRCYDAEKLHFKPHCKYIVDKCETTPPAINAPVKNTHFLLQFLFIFHSNFQFSSVTQLSKILRDQCLL